jgi:hypothetical protein
MLRIGLWVDGIGVLSPYHSVLGFEGRFAGHHVAEGGDSADLDGEGDALGDTAVRRSDGETNWGCGLVWGTYIAFWEVARVRWFGFVGGLLGGVFGGFIVVVTVAVAGGGHVGCGWVFCISRVSGVFGRCGRMEEKNRTGYGVAS